MEFNQIGKNFNPDFSAPAFKEGKNPVPEKPAREEGPRENSPADPSYWQAQRKISFKGTSCQGSEEVRRELTYYYRGRLGARNWERYKVLVEDWLECLPETTLEQADDLGGAIIKLFVGYEEGFNKDEKDFDKKREFFQDFLKNEDYTIKEKADYLKMCGQRWRVDFKDFAEQTPVCMETYSRFRKAFDDEDGKFAEECFNSSWLDTDQLNKLSDIVEEGKISPNAFKDYLSRFPRFPDKKITEGMRELIDTLISIKDDEDHKGAFPFFESMASLNLSMDPPSPKLIKDLIDENSSFKFDLIDYFEKEAIKDDTRIFSGDAEILLALNFLNSENFKHFKGYRNFDANMDKTIYEVMCSAREYINPKTQLFDINLYRLNQQFKTKGKEKKFLDYYSNAIARAAVDMQTGEISPMALKFLDKYYFQIEDAQPTGAIKRFIQNLKPGAKYTQRHAFYKHTYTMEIYVPEILNAMKDKTGAFNETNYKYISKIMESVMPDFYPKFGFLNSMKDENGVIQKDLYDLGMKILKATSSTSKTQDTLDIVQKFGKEKAGRMYETLNGVFKAEDQTVKNFPACAKKCFDENGDVIKEKLDYVAELAKYIPGLVLDETVLNLADTEEDKKFILDCARANELDSNDLTYFEDLYERYGNKEGGLDSFVKTNLKKALKRGVDVCTFMEIFKASIKDDKDYKNNFDEEFFDTVVNICGANPSLYWDIGGMKMLTPFIKGEFDISRLNFKEKVTILEDFKKVKRSLEDSNIECYPFIEKIISEIDNSFADDNISLPVDKDSKANFLASIIGTGRAKEGELSEFETVITESIPLLKEMKTEGLKISYPRKEFLADLSALCDSKEKLKLLSDKTSIDLITDDKGNIQGYNGIILLDKLDKNDPFQNEIYKICRRFFYENEAKTGNEALDKELNKIIKACPEFLNSVGKQQHGTHKYSLDIHELLVLANSINNPDYLKLNPADKAMLKITCLLHDTAKHEGVVDKGHQDPSAIYTRSIIKKFFTNPEIRDRVYELVKNHHWLEEFSNDHSDIKARELAYRFRRPNDFDIAKIMAGADLMAVSDSFYFWYKDSLNPEKIKPIEDKLQELYASGCAVFSDYPVIKSELENHKETLGGKEYKVINFHKTDPTEDLGKYGFRTGLTKNDVKFLVHMVDSTELTSGLSVVQQLSSSVNAGVLSESLITPNHNRTYCNRQYGLLLSQINPNVVNVSKTNQGSGYAKDMNDVLSLVWGTQNKSRNEFKKQFLSKLHISQNEVSDKEYAEFYRKHIASKTSLSEFVDTKEYSLGKFQITGAELKRALNETQESIIDKKDIEHNEIVGFAPKIQGVVAKAKTLSEVSSEVLAFARENDLPVLLI